MMVSILTLAYNHEPYIRQCLDGIVMQQTNFKFELLVHDDASTDGTAEIIREYESKYPEIIKPIYQTENQYSKHVPIGTTYLYPRAQGKYIALCEGDDYWTDPLKLQKQVDFLESNQDYVLCTHCYKLYLEKEQGYGEIRPFITESRTFDFEEYISYTNWLTQPLTAVFKNEVSVLDEYAKCKNAKDRTLFFLLLEKGKGYIMKETMGVYRIHEGGIWSGVSRKKQCAGEITSVLCLYNDINSIAAVRTLNNYLIRLKYIGISFLSTYYKLYFKCIKAIFKELGFKAAIKCIYYNCTYPTIQKIINKFI